MESWDHLETSKENKEEKKEQGVAGRQGSTSKAGNHSPREERQGGKKRELGGTVGVLRGRGTQSYPF